MTADVIGEHWDVPRPAPVAAAPLRWSELPRAWLDVAFAPRDVGPRLAVSGWGLAVLTHFVALFSMFHLAVFGAVAMDSLESGTISFERYLAHLGNAYDDIQREFGRFLSDPVALPVIALFLGIWLAALFVTAALIQPFIAAGELRSRAFGRALRLTLWGSIAGCFAQFPMWWCIGVVLVAHRWGIDIPSRVEEALGIVLVSVVLPSWLLSVLLRLGARYAGPAVGPGLELPTARCVACGYQLTGLVVAGRCPECGQQISESPPWRFQLAACETVRGWQWWRAAARTAARCWRPEELLAHTSVRRSSQGAQQFAWVVLLAVGLLAGSVWFVAAAGFDPRTYAYSPAYMNSFPAYDSWMRYRLLADAIAVACANWAVGVAWLGVLTSALHYTTRGDNRAVVHAVCYTSPVLLASAVLPAFAQIAGYSVTSPYGTRVSLWPLYLACSASGPVLHAWLAWRGWRSARYAPV
jgi:hypothetical protein